ncbi:uncharacterized protein LOC141619967 [Silene latifolia]|uniref:uncharacterized protein LOC141619967 n=1 Tax=Silene latifolia TaxID=37657 RepID=UPI003D7814C3
MFDNKPLVVKPWTENVSLTKEKVKKVPIWVRICGLALKFWGTTCLEKISSLIGTYMRSDGATKNKTRIGYARVMIEVEVGQKFPDKLYFKDEKGHDVSVLVEYERKPVTCSVCNGIGHEHGMCKKKSVPKPATKPTVVPTKVWRPVSKPEHPVQGNAPTVPAVASAGAGIINRNQSGPPFNSCDCAYQNKVRLYGLVETKIKDNDYPKVLSNLGQQWRGVHNSHHHPGGRVWLIWIDTSFHVTLITSSDQQITAKVIDVASGDEFLYTVVYGHNDDLERKILWQELKDIKDRFDGPWSIAGDFNNVLNFNEKIGRDVVLSDIVDFRECVDYFGMTDAKGMGAFFTWNNKHKPHSRVFSRIDRFLINWQWLRLYPKCYVYFMPEGLFDHNPCICFRRNVQKRKPHFRYFNMWGQDPNFKQIVSHHWSKPIPGTLMF